MQLEKGMYNIYKPVGPTSHDIVDRIRRVSGEAKVGHAGTLDPFAEGVLIVAVGREYTKKLGAISKQDKTYKATIKLGAETDTYDLTGKVIHQSPQTQIVRPTRKDIASALKKFSGEIEQTPPPFSAIKIKGKKAYELARRGIIVKLKPRKIKIHYIKIKKYKWPYLEIETKVSSGTYIRSLAHSLGKKLKTGGYLEKLERTSVGKYKISDSIRI